MNPDTPSTPSDSRGSPPESTAEPHDSLDYTSSGVDDLRPIETDASSVESGTYISPAYAEYKHGLAIRKRLQSIALVITAILLLAGTVFTLVHKKSGQNALQTGEFSKTSVPLDSIPQLSSSQTAATLRVNGQLQADSSIVLAPTSQPTNPVLGQIYFDQTAKQLRYYNGSDFNTLGEQVTNITNNTFITQGSTSGPAVLLQSTNPGTAQTGGFNVSGTGTASVLQGTNSVITPSVDAAGGTLSVGTANAGGISIGKNGITATINGALSVNQTTTLGGDLTVSGLGNVAFQRGADYSVTGISDDVDFGQGSLFRLTGTSGQVITGIAGGTDGRIIRIVNAGSTGVLLANNSTNSQPGNRITTGTGTDITIPVDASVSLVYDSGSNVWRNVGVATTPGGGGGSGSYVNLQASTPGTADAGNFNITGTGRVGTLSVVGNGTIGGTLTATSLSGNGSGVTNVDAVTLQGHNTAYFNNASNLSTGTVVSGLVTGSYTGITAVGTLTGLTVNGTGSFTGRVSGANAVSNNEFVTLSQLNSAVGGVSTVSSLNTLVGGLTLQGTVGQITVTSNGTNTLTLSLNSAVTLQGNTFNGAGQLVKLDGSGFLPALNGSALTNLNGSNISSGTVNDGRLSTNVAKYNDSTANFTGTLQHNGNNVCDTSGNCTGVSGGSIGGGGTAGTIAVFSGSGFTIANSLLAQSAGTVTVSGNLSATNLSGNGSSVTNVDAATLQGHNTAYFTNASNLSTGTVSSSLISGSYTGITAVGTLTGLSVSGNGSFTGTVSGADAVSNNQFVTLSQLNAAIGGVGGGVTALNALSGSLNLQGTSGQITVSSNGTDTLTLAVGNNVTLQGNTFNGANQLVKLDGTGKLPALDASALTNLNASNLSSGTVASGRISGGYTGITAVGTLTGLTVNGTGSFTGTVSGADAVNGNDFVTKNQLSGAVGGVTPSLQEAYNNSSSPATITLDSTRLGITIKDASTTIGGNLLTVQNNAGTASYLTVTTSGASVVGTFSVTGGGSFTGRVSGADAVSSNEFVTLSQLTGAVGGVGSGVTTVGALDGGTYSDDGASISGSTIYLQSATSTHTGLVNYGVQTFGGDKTFADDVTVSGGLTATTLQGDGAGITNLDAGNLATGTIDDARLSTNVAKYNDSTANFTGTLQHNGNNVCDTSGNCVGVSGGAIGGSGTAGKLAVFTGSGFTIGDSLLSQSGTTVTVAGTLAATNLSGNGSGVTNVDAATLQGHNTAYFANASNLTSGTVASSLISGSYNGITAVGTLTGLTVNGTGSFTGTVSGADAVGGSDFVTLSQLNAAIGGGGVTSLNSLIGGLTLQGTSGKVSVTSNGTDTLTLDLDASVTLQGNTFNGINQLVKLDGSGFLPALNGSALTNLNASALTTGTVAGGLLSGSYTGITAVGTLTSLNVTGAGTFGGRVSGADAVGSSDFVTLSQLNTAIGGVSGVSSLNLLSGALNIQGTSGQLTISDNGTDTLTLALDSSVTLQGNTFNGANQLVQLNGSGFLPALNGSALTALNASNLASGTVNDSRLSANVALYNAVTANFTGTLQHAGNNVCDASNNCGYLTASAANGSYIQLQSTTPGTPQTGHFNISGTGIADTLKAVSGIQTPSLDTASAGTLNLGLTNATAITLNQNTTVASGKSFGVSGGGTTLTGAATGDALTVNNSTSTGNIAVFQDNGTTVATIADGGAVALQNSVDSTTAFQVKNQAGGNILGVDTIGKTVTLGVPTTPLVNDTYTTTPTGTLQGNASYVSGQYVQLIGGSVQTGRVEYTLVSATSDFDATYQFWTGGSAGSSNTQWLYAYDTASPTGGGSASGGYHVSFNTTANTISLYFNGSLLTSVSQSSMGNSVFHSIEVTKVGTSIRVYYEGAMVINYTDIVRTLSGTKFGLGAASAGNTQTYRVKNFIFSSSTAVPTGNVALVVSGTAKIGPATDSTTVFQIQNTAGSNLFNADTSNMALTVGGSIAYLKGTDFSTTGSSNDVNFGAGALFRLTGASAQTITGIAGGTDGRMITLVNAGTAAATIANNSASSSAANRITTGTGANINLQVGGSISLIYDTTSSLWRVIGTSSSLSGSYINNGTAVQTANFNIQSASTGSIAAVIQAAAGQTVDLFELRDSGGNAMFSATAGGQIWIQPGIDSANTFQVLAHAGNYLFNVDTQHGNTVIGTSSSASNQSNLLTLTSAGFTNLLDIQDDTQTKHLLTVDSAGHFKSRNSTDSTTAFQVQNATGTTLLNADTSGMTLTVSGSVAFQKGTDFSTTGSSNNVNFGTGALFRLTGASAQTITGIAGGVDGRMITLINAGAAAATIANNSASSSAANRITTGTGANINLQVGGSISLIYDSGASLWRVTGSTATTGGGGSGFVTLQGSTPGTADTGNFNVSGSGIANILQGTTSVNTPLVDTVSAGTLSVGTATATAVSIGKSGATTTVNGALAVTQNATFGANLNVTSGNVVFGGDYNHSISVGAATNGAGGALSISGGGATLPSAPNLVGNTLTSLTSTSISASYPSGLQVGDIMVMTVEAQSTITSPSGWTVLSASHGNGSVQGALFVKTVTLSDIGGSILINSGGGGYAGIIAFHNVSGVRAWADNFVQATSMNVGPVSVNAGDPVIYGSVYRAGSGSTTFSTGTIINSGANGGAVAAIGYGTAASTGTITQTYGNLNQVWGDYGTAVSLIPSSGGASGGSLVLSGGAGVGTGSDGSVVVKNANNSTSTFQIQNASSTVLLSADTTNMALSLNGNTTVTASGASTALNIVQGQAAAGININSSNNTATDAISISGTVANILNAPNIKITNAGNVTMGGDLSHIISVGTATSGNGNSLSLIAGAGTIPTGVSISGSSFVTISGSSSANVPYPAGLQVGDIMVLTLGARSSSTGTPAGWTLQNNLLFGSTWWGYVYTKTATLSDIGGSVNVSINAVIGAQISIVAVHNASAIHDIKASISNANTTTATSLAVTNGDYVLYAGNDRQSSVGTYSLSSGTIFNSIPGNTDGGAFLGSETASSTGTMSQTFTATTGSVTYGAMLSFTPAGAGANGGNLYLSGGASAGTGTAGTVIVKNQANSTTAFQVQNSSGTGLLTADTTNMGVSVGGTLAVSQASTFSGNVTVTSGNNLTFGGDSDHTLSVAQATSGNGGALNIKAGSGRPTSVPSVVGQTITPVPFANSITANYPAGLQVGDLLVMTVGHAYSITNPSGWTVKENTGNQANTSGGLFTKTVQAGDIGGSVSLTFNGSAYYGEVIIIAARNIGAVHDFGTFRIGSSTSSQTTGPIAVSGGDLVLYGGFARLTNATISLAHGTTLAQRTTDTNSGAVAGSEIAASDGTLSQTFTDNTSANGAYDTMISLTPAGDANGGNLVLGGGAAAGAGTQGSVIVKNGVNSTTSFQIQNSSGTALFTADTSGMGITVGGAATIAGNLTVTNAGNVAFQKGTDFSTTGSSNDVNFGTGSLFRLTGASAQTITGIANGADGRIITLVNAGANAATIANNSASSSAANRITTGTGANISLASGGSISLVYDSGASLWRVIGTTAAAGGGASYVTLQGSTPGTADTGNFNVTGTGIAANLQGTTSVKTALLDSVSAGALSIGTSTATSITVGQSGVTTTFNGSVSVAASNSLRLVGGNTASRPGSPTEGMLYYDTTTKQLLVYANGKWKSDGTTSTKIVAASNSSQAAQDAADYVASGSGDQATINSALTAASGGLVYLMEGTYNVSAAISIPNNTTLAGAGAGSLITVPNAQNGSYNIITNSDTTTGTHVNIRDLRIDGNNANETSGTMYGIYLNGMGGGTGSSARDGAKLTNLIVRNMQGGDGIRLSSSSNNTVANNTTLGNDGSGIYLDGSSNNTVTGNTSQGNATMGIYLNNSSATNTITGNTFQGNAVANIYVRTSSNNNTITGNTSQGSAVGVYLFGSANNTVAGNTLLGNTAEGIHLESSANNNTISSNNIADSGGTTDNRGIYISASDSNTITGNNITDSSATSNNYAIYIPASTSDTNYLADNTLGTGSINDLGTGTIYGGQLNASGNYVIQPAGNVSLNGATAVSGNLSQSSGSLSLQANATSQITTSSGNLTLDAAGTLNVGTSTTTISIGGSSSTSTFTGTLVVGSGGNTMTITSTGYVLAGNARNAKVIRLPAEYAGAVLDTGATGNNTGTMTSGYDQTNRMNYYKWTTTQVSNQTYDVVVQVPLPKDFDAWNTNPIQLTAYTSDTTNGTITVQVIKSNGSADSNFASFQSATPGSTSTWTVKNFTTLDSSNYTAGDYVTIRIRLQSPTSGDVRIGNLVLNYLSNK